MAAMSDTLEISFLDHVTGNAAYSPASAVYLGLTTSSGGFADGNTGTEVIGNGYQRQAITFGASSTSSIASNAAVTFPRSTAGQGTVYGWGIFSAQSAGDLLYHGMFSSSRAVLVDESFYVASGAISLTPGGAMQGYAFQNWSNLTLRNVAWSMPTALYMALDRASTGTYTHDLSAAVNEPPWHDHATGTLPSTAGRSYPYNMGSQSTAGGKDDNVASMNEKRFAGVVNGTSESYGGYNRVKLSFNAASGNSATLAKSTTRDAGRWDNTTARNTSWDSTNSRWQNWGATVLRDYTDRVEFPIIVDTFGVIGGQSGAGNITNNIDGSGGVIDQETARVNNAAGLQDGGGDSYWSSSYTTYVESGANASASANALYYTPYTVTYTGIPTGASHTTTTLPATTPTPSSQRRYGIIQGYAIYDAESGGNLLFRGTLNSYITATDAKDVIRIPASDIALVAA